MSLSIYAMATDTFIPMLRSLGECIEKGKRQKGQAVDLADARLAPDMYTLAQQVQQACFYARDAMARLAGDARVAMGEAADTIDGAIAQIKETIAAVQATSESDFHFPEDVDCSIDIPGNKLISMNGVRFLRNWSIPHFYFHVVTGYDILRHVGVDIGKYDYMSQVAGFIREKSA